MNSWQSRPWYTGSSPRMRGALTWVPDTHAESRIIHADAGSTAMVDLGDVMRRDHPRGCGEHFCRPCSMTWLTGSSPRMRGAHIVTSYSGRGARIIPADAGSTSLRTSMPHCLSNHPRGCGEHTDLDARTYVDAGSSPRMRGAPTTIRSCIPIRRIIPADAGSTFRTLKR